MKRLSIYLILLVGMFLISFGSAATYPLNPNYINITTCAGLQNIENNLTANYQLLNDITCSGEFTPIGYVAGTGYNIFSGNFDGRGFTISNLYINKSADDHYIGLFAYTTGNISNIGLINGNVTGSRYVGGLVGSSSGSITNSYSTENVTGSLAIGGLVGWQQSGSITNSYSTGNVTGSSNVGGLVARQESGSITNSYSTGNVTGSGYVGGLVGRQLGGSITNSFWDNQTSGQSTSAGGTGLTTLQMKNIASFNTWNITYGANLNNGYPYLSWQNGLTTPIWLIVGDDTTPQVYLNSNSPSGYVKIGDIVTLNITATDVNLSKVWYNYNGTNVYLTGALSGIANLSNIILNSNKTVTIYANNTAGNLNTTIFNLNYKVFYNSDAYVNTTYSGVSNPFTINITSPNISTLKVNYNGTNYTAASYPSGSDTIGSVNIVAPTFSTDQNVSFYWIFTMLDGSVVTNTAKNQTVNTINLGNTYSNLIYNITVIDENTDAVIPNTNVTMSYEVTYGTSNTSIIGTNLFNDNKLANKNISSMFL